jgi:hypothetical protein
VGDPRSASSIEFAYRQVRIRIDSLLLLEIGADNSCVVGRERWRLSIAAFRTAPPRSTQSGDKSSPSPGGPSFTQQSRDQQHAVGVGAAMP